MSAVARRVELLRERVEAEHGPSLLFFVTIVCNRCGRTQTVNQPDPNFERDFVGWHLTETPEDADLCPACAQ